MESFFHSLSFSLGTITIMITLITKPSWTLSNGDLDIFYQVIGAVLSGSIFGDHG